MVSYLHCLHMDNKSYSVLNTHKSMLLQTLPFFGNSWCSNPYLISKFMKGIFNLKPPTPRYCFTWDVSVVLKFLRTLYPLEKLSLKMLTFKTVALIALACAPRAQTLVSLNIDYMKVKKKEIVCWFPNLLKTSKIGKSYQMCLEHFSEENLCVMHTVLFYMRTTESQRKCKNLLISYVTFDSVRTSTVARWIKLVLDSSGVDTSVFKAHSFRSASTSAAMDAGCSLRNVLKTADWGSSKNFYKFYYRAKTTNGDKSFTKAVFGH